MLSKQNIFGDIDTQCIKALPDDQVITDKNIDAYKQEAEIHHAAYWPYWLARGYIKHWALQNTLAKVLSLHKIENNVCIFNKLVEKNKPYSSWLKAEPHCFVFKDSRIEITLAISLPIDQAVINKWSMQCQKSIRCVVVDYAIAEKIVMQTLFEITHDYCLSENKSADDIISQCCHTLLLNAITRRATDIHGEPTSKNFQVRFRIDGLLQHYCTFPIAISRKITNRLKVMSQRDLAITRLPQDGHLTIIGHPSGVRDARINFCPLLYGEKWVIRLLNSQQKTPHLRYLDLMDDDREKMAHIINQPQGLILVTGPTGSGKTTTLYALLETLNTPEVNICTIEDPVEQHLENINQIEVKPAAGLTFAVGLRALLRQDPNIIMIGEIRDKETAAIALNAAQTGHIVFATLHSNSTSHTISRLLSMGFHPEQLSQTLLCVIAQRLVRMNFHNEEVQNTEENPLYEHPYKSRVAIYEIMTIDDALRRIIEQAPFDREALESMACKQGMKMLSESGEMLIDEGFTDRKEIERVLCH
jgi:type II secretory ATPase GspE/PulE/Tfp pilus assembly ATPase PilB-like protein